MKKKLIALLVTFIMAFALLPAGAMAENVTYTMDFVVDEAQSWAGNINPRRSDCSGDGWKWEILHNDNYDGTSSEARLTLTNFNFSTSAHEAMLLPENTTIVLEGASSVTSLYSGFGNSVSYGVSSLGNLTITSESGGTLTATGGNVNAQVINSCGVAVKGPFALSGNADVTAVGGSANGGAFSSSYGLFVSGEHAAVTVSDTATLKATGGTSQNKDSCGIFSINGVTVNGGTVKATGGNAGADGLSCGIYARKSAIVITGLKNNNAALSGSLIAQSTGTGGTKQAFSKQPVFSNDAQTEANWYKWRVASSDSFTESYDNAYE